MIIIVTVNITITMMTMTRVHNPTIAVSNVENFSHSTRLLAATTLRNVLGTKVIIRIMMIVMIAIMVIIIIIMINRHDYHDNDGDKGEDDQLQDAGDDLCSVSELSRDSERERHNFAHNAGFLSFSL